MTVLLDTCTLSHVARRHPNVLARFAAADAGQLAVSTITVHEVEYGLKANPDADRRVGSVMRDLLRAVRHLPFDDACALRAASVRAALRKAGTPIGAYDLLIAATALEHGLVLATSNVRELTQIPDLPVDDWSA